jgi:hypothetical protein
LLRLARDKRNGFIDALFGSPKEACQALRIKALQLMVLSSTPLDVHGDIESIKEKGRC